MRNREWLARRVGELGEWFHNLDLYGVSTAPNHFLGDFPNIKWKHIEPLIPRDLSGATVLDIGCNGGFYSIEMKRRGAERVIGIDVDDHRWPRLVQAATFESMRSRADTTVPAGGPEHWIDPAAFFSRGTSGQWRDLLDDADLARYAARVRALASANLVEWVHREPID